MSEAPLMQLVRVDKSFGEEVVTPVLKQIDLAFARGGLTALVGPSGSGKSTLLNLLGLLDRPTHGRILVNGQDTGDLDEGAVTRLRGRALGFIFQFHHLLPGFTAEENVALPLAAAAGRLERGHLVAAREVLDLVGLSSRRQHLPSQLSGGQQQRVAVARALVHRPGLVLADEPTGNLDSATAEEVFGLMLRFHRELGTAFLVVTHDPRLAERCPRVIELVDGKVRRDEVRA